MAGLCLKKDPVNWYCGAFSLQNNWMPAPFFIYDNANQQMAGWIYLIGASVLGIWFLMASIQAARSKTDEKARKLLLVSVLYLPILFALMVFDH